MAKKDETSPPNPFDAKAGAPEAKGAESKKWPNGAEEALVRLSDRRASAKSKLESAIDTRDAGLVELATMSKQPTDAEKKRACDVVRALLAIKYNRFVIGKCANNMDKVIGEAKQGRLFKDDDEGEIPTEQMYLKDLSTRGEGEDNKNDD